MDDTTGNFNRLRQTLHTGSRDYKCLSQCSASTQDGVQVSFGQITDGFMYWNWCTTIPLISDQNGSDFAITSIKESTTTGYGPNAFIIKGTFNCNLFEYETGVKKVLTDGKFTCILAAF